MAKPLSQDERIDHLWQYWLPQALVKAAQLAPDDPKLKQAIVDELRTRHHTQIVLLRRERVSWEYLLRHGRWYANPFLMDEERAAIIQKVTRFRLNREKRGFRAYVAQQLGSGSQQGPVGD